jgi:membrane protease YdiL (CAAX protease family)
MALDTFDPGQTPAPPSLADVTIGDLLLALIVGIGATRLSGVLVFAVLAGPGRQGTGELPDLQLMVMLVLAVQTVGMIGAIYLFAVYRRGIAWAEIGLRPLSDGWLVRAVAVGLIAFVLASLLNFGVQSLMAEPPRNPQLDFIAPDGFSWRGLLVTLIFVGAIVPFAEELFFRGLIYGWLRQRMSVGLAASISGFGFAVLHGIWWLIPALALLGIILALVYERSGSIWTAVITHGLFNSATTVIFYLALATGLELPV